MPLYFLEFLHCQLARFLQDLPGYAELAYIMEYRTDPELAKLCGIKPETDACYKRQDTDIDRVLKSIVIHRFYLCKII